MGALHFAERAMRLADQAVAVVGAAGLDLAVRGELEALFGARLRLHFGHLRLLIGRCGLVAFGSPRHALTPGGPEEGATYTKSKRDCKVGARSALAAVAIGLRGLPRSIDHAEILRLATGPRCHKTFRSQAALQKFTYCRRAAGHPATE